MVKKKNKRVDSIRRVGLLQMVFGFILFIGIIVSFFLFPSYFEDKELEIFELMDKDYANYWENSSLEIRAIGLLDVGDIYQNHIYFIENQKKMIYCTKIILFILSIILILNGYINFLRGDK